MKTSFTPTGWKSIFTAFYEYFLIIVPVGVYVSLEAIHKNEFYFFFLSPEWGIATIFLAFQGIALYIKNLNKSQKKLNLAIILPIFLCTVLITICAIINSLLSLMYSDGESISLIIFRILLFIFTTLGFLFLVAGARTISLTEGDLQENE